jgi:hypothetical protein
VQTTTTLEASSTTATASYLVGAVANGEGLCAAVVCIADAVDNIADQCILY